MGKEQLLIDGALYDAETGELVNEVEQVEIEIVEDNLPDIICNGGTHIQTNSDQLKRELIKHLEKYDIEVTEETEKDASKMATELNKLSNDLDKKRKETAKIIKKPADDLKTSIDELINIIQEKRTNILESVNVFKTKRMDTIRNLLNAKIEELYKEYKISDRYRVCNIEPLVLEGSFAKVGLAKNAIETLTAMVNKVKLLESQVEIRELQLQIICENAGLITSITLNEVQDIIEEDNYDVLLAERIEHRVKLQEQIKEQMERDQKQRQIIIQQEEDRKNQEQIKEEEVKKEILKEIGKKIVTVVATFKVEVNEDVDESKIIDKYESKLKEMFTTLETVTPF